MNKTNYSNRNDDSRQFLRLTLIRVMAFPYIHLCGAGRYITVSLLFDKYVLKTISIVFEMTKFIRYATSQVELLPPVIKRLIRSHLSLTKPITP